MQRVNQAIYQKLRQILPEQVKIYPVIADEDAKLPLCVYNGVSFNTDTSKDGIEEYQFSYTVQLWTVTFDECDELATIVTEKMNGIIGEKIEAILSSGSSGYDNGAFFQELSFNVVLNV